MCLLTETRALSAQGEKRALVGNLTMPLEHISEDLPNELSNDDDGDDADDEPADRLD